MNRNVSFMITSRAGGQYFVADKNPDCCKNHGAVPPFIIHKQPTITRKDGIEKTLDDVMKEEKESVCSAGLNAADKEGNDCDFFGFSMRTTPKGSMQQDIF
eukprot:11240235-Ditylum_brightwellii.AAC.1